LYDAKTIRELKEKLKRYEDIKTDTNKRTNDKQTIKRCYNCGDAYHLSASCPMRKNGIKYFRCNQYGDMTAKCTAKATDIKDVKKHSVAQADTGLIKLYLKTIEINNYKVKALMDTSNIFCMIRKDYHNKIGAAPLINQTMQFRSVGGGLQETLGKMQIEMRIDYYIFKVMCHIVPNSYTKCEAIVGLDVLIKIIMKVDGGIPIISGLREQESYWAQLNEIDIARKTDQLDLSYITNQSNKSKITKLIAEYKIDKSKEISMELNFVLQDDIPVYQRAQRLSQSEQEEVNT